MRGGRAGAGEAAGSHRQQEQGQQAVRGAHGAGLQHRDTATPGGGLFSEKIAESLGSSQKSNRHAVSVTYQ